MRLIVRYISFILAVLLLIQCEKLFDFRDKYIGTWAFEYYITTIPMYGDTIRDSVFYTGLISPGPDKHQLYIQYTEDSNLLIEVERDGSFSHGCYYTKWSTCYGNFEGENILNHQFGGANLSTRWTVIIKGRKIK